MSYTKFTMFALKFFLLLLEELYKVDNHTLLE